VIWLYSSVSAASAAIRSASLVRTSGLASAVMRAGSSASTAVAGLLARHAS